jgi:hypothetical protein
MNMDRLYDAQCCSMKVKLKYSSAESHKLKKEFVKSSSMIECHKMIMNERANSWKHSIYHVK